MVYEIVKYGDEVLRRESTPVAEVTDEIRQLAADMLETMYAAQGVGLAAEQVGRTERICVIDVPHDAEKPEWAEFNAAIPMPLVLVNPEVTSLEGVQRDDEGCLSFPGIYAKISRGEKVVFFYTDLEGKRRSATAGGLLARAVQHETDHLFGVTMIDKMSQLQRMSIAGKLRRLRDHA